MLYKLCVTETVVNTIPVRDAKEQSEVHVLLRVTETVITVTPDAIKSTTILLLFPNVKFQEKAVAVNADPNRRIIRKK